MCYPRFVVGFSDQTIGSRIVMCSYLSANTDTLAAQEALWRLDHESRFRPRDGAAIS